MSILPESELTYLVDKGFAFEEYSEAGQHALIIKDYILPLEKFDHNSANILILLPPGFPDTPPDMFYLYPWLKLKTGSFPRAADIAHPFNGITWQRWSRHSNEWRAGRDGLASYIKRIQNAIETAT